MCKWVNNNLVQKNINNKRSILRSTNCMRMQVTWDFMQLLNKLQWALSPLVAKAKRENHSTAWI